MPEKDLTAQDMDVLFAARGVKSAQSTPTATPPEEPCPGCKEKLPTTPSLPYPAPPSPAPPTEPAHPTPYPAPPTEPTTTWQTESTRLRKQLTDAIRGVQPAPTPKPVPPPTTPMPGPSPRTPSTPAAAAPQELRWSQLGVGYVNMRPFTRPMVNGGLSGQMRGEEIPPVFFRPNEVPSSDEGWEILKEKIPVHVSVRGRTGTVTIRPGSPDEALVGLTEVPISGAPAGVGLLDSCGRIYLHCGHPEVPWKASDGGVVLNQFFTIHVAINKDHCPKGVRLVQIMRTRDATSYHMDSAPGPLDFSHQRTTSEGTIHFDGPGSRDSDPATWTAEKWAFKDGRTEVFDGRYQVWAICVRADGSYCICGHLDFTVAVSMDVQKDKREVTVLGLCEDPTWTHEGVNAAFRSALEEDDKEVRKALRDGFDFDGEALDQASKALYAKALSDIADILNAPVCP